MAQEIELTIRRDGEDNDVLDAYRQVYHQLRAAILAGALPPGARLPSSRALARRAGVARVTIVQAYDMLKAEGYVESRGGAGTFVSNRLAGPASGASAPPFRPALTEWGRRALDLGRSSERAAGEAPASRAEIDFGFGRSFAELFPYDVWRRLLGRYLSTDDAMLSRYGSAAGFGPLRAAVADYLTRARGVRCAADQVVIVSGAQQALDILARLLLAPGDEVVVETPGYRDAFTLFRLHRARLVGLPVDAEGLPVDRIPAGCRARFVFVTPS
uniref:aminotransferase-like domain-containing protein n=1 Tax=Promineifilum sp. TaxID=2664178 RepID=UPI0035AD7BB2